MPLPLILAGIGVGAYLLGRFFKTQREEHLENQLKFSEDMRAIRQTWRQKR